MVGDILVLYANHQFMQRSIVVSDRNFSLNQKKEIIVQTLQGKWLEIVRLTI